MPTGFVEQFPSAILSVRCARCVEYPIPGAVYETQNALTNRFGQTKLLDQDVPQFGVRDEVDYTTTRTIF